MNPDYDDGLLRIFPSCAPYGLAFCGVIDMTNHTAVAATLHRVGAQGARDLHVNVTEVEYIDAGGLRLLAQVAAELPSPQRLVVAAPSAQMLKVIKLAGWDQSPNLIIKEG